jgi:hypothetical protein
MRGAADKALKYTEKGMSDMKFFGYSVSGRENV